MCIIILFLVLTVAAITDLLFDKIYNEWLLGAMAAGLCYAVWKDGAAGLLRALVSMTIPFALLYPLFIIGGLGAGDVKLLSVAGCFLTIKESIWCLGLSFLLGAAISLLKMAVERNFLERMKYRMSWMFLTAENGSFMRKMGGTEKREKRGRYIFPCRCCWGW